MRKRLNTATPPNVWSFSSFVFVPWHIRIDISWGECRSRNEDIIFGQLDLRRKRTTSSLQQSMRSTAYLFSLPRTMPFKQNMTAPKKLRSADLLAIGLSSEVSTCTGWRCSGKAYLPRYVFVVLDVLVSIGLIFKNGKDPKFQEKLSSSYISCWYVVPCLILVPLVKR